MPEESPIREDLKRLKAVRLRLGGRKDGHGEEKGWGEREVCHTIEGPRCPQGKIRAVYWRPTKF